MTRLSFPLENISPLGSDKRFAALEKQFVQRPGRAYLAFTFHGTAPLVNRKGMSITVPTHRNSVESAIDALVDYEHEAEDLPTGSAKTNQVGHICALYVDDADMDNMGWYIQDIIPRQPVLTRGVMALQTRIRSVKEIVDEIQAKRENWYFSLEIGEDVPPPEIWVFDDNEHNIMSWDEAPEDLRSAASQPQEVTWKDKKVAYLMGGRNGVIPYIGGAVTRYPAGREQDAVPGNQLKFICNWTGDADIENELKFAVYSKIEDVPANLRTINKIPLTLSQINGIVRQAEAIEREGEATNGWAVAKAHFMDTHTIRDGRWVEKAKKAASGGGDEAMPDLNTAAEWTTAFINDLPNSSFAVIEGDYLSGKTDNKNCRHLPFKDGGGKVDLPHLRNALARMNQIKPVSGPESAAQLQAKAKAKLEKYRSYLKTEKAASEGLAEMDDISPLDIKTWQDLKRIADLVRDITSEEEGGMKMPITLEQEELDAKLKQAGDDRLKKAIEEGEVIAKDKAAAMFTQEQMDEYVAKTVMTREREKAIAALGADEATASEYLLLAKNEELFPMNEDGHKKFGEAVQRWQALIKPAAGDGGNGDGGGVGDDKHQASMAGTGTPFDPGAGSQAGTGASGYEIKRYGAK